MPMETSSLPSKIRTLGEIRLNVTLKFENGYV